jgi:hypothetical protein
MMIIIDNVMTITYIMTLFTIIDDTDDDSDYMTRNLCQDDGNNYELDDWHDVDMSKGVVRDADYDNYDNNYDNGDGHFDLKVPLASYKDNFR